MVASTYKINSLLVLFLMFCVSFRLQSAPSPAVSELPDAFVDAELFALLPCIETQTLPPDWIPHLIQHKAGRNKKIIAALLAFPFPFGIVGLHRIYLGTSPHVPVVYIATLGGGFGLLPLLDFFAILFEKNMERFINNDRVFMWIN